MLKKGSDHYVLITKLKEKNGQETINQGQSKVQLYSIDSYKLKRQGNDKNISKIINGNVRRTEK